MHNNSEKVSVLINMHKDLKKDLMLLAREDGRSMTSYVVRALEGHVKRVMAEKETENITERREMPDGKQG